MAANTKTSAESGSKPGLVLLVVSAAVFLASLDLFIVNIAFPDIRLAFPGSGLATMSWILNGYTVVFAALLAPAGRLADRYGRRLVFLVGVAVFTVGSAACAVATSIPLLVAFRAIQAIGAALVMPTSLALLLAAFPPAKRAVAVSAWAAVGGVAGALGPPVGGLLVQASWRWVFLVNLPVGVLALIFGPRVLRESKESGSGVPDLLGAVGLVIGVGALAWALVEGPDHGWTSRMVLIAFGVAIVGALWVVRRSARHPVPVLDLPALRVPTLWLACVAMLVFTTGFAAMLFGNVLFLTGVWHNSLIDAGLSLIPGPLMVVAVSFTVGGRLVQRFGPGPVAAAGGVFFAIGAGIWVWRIGPVADFAAALLPGQLFTGLGVGLVMPSLSGVVGTVLPPDRWGAGSSMINTSRQIGAVLGTAILVVIYGATPTLTDFRHGWIFLASTALATTLAGFAIAARKNSADAYAAPVAGPSDRPSLPSEGVDAWLLGRIRRPDDDGLSGAMVTVIDRRGQQVDRSFSDENGEFSIVARPQGPVLLLVSKPGYHPEVLELREADRSRLSLTLSPVRSSVCGEVIYSTGTPAAGAVVVLTDQDGEVLASQRTSSDGRYEFEGLAPGPYTLTVARSSGLLSVQGIAIAAGKHTHREVVVPAPGRLSGVVSDGSRPVARARVTLLDAQGNIVGSQITTDSGRYDFPDLAHGEYRVIATGYPPSASTVQINGHGENPVPHNIELSHQWSVLTAHAD
jgi:EmrB/QacA subfamily drug resistance transporter